MTHSQAREKELSRRDPRGSDNAIRIAVAIIVAVNALGQKLVAVFNSISAKLVPAT